MMKRKRRNITLIEIMIVMFLIALITGVIAYNYRGSMDEGKNFKTKAGMEKLETILSLYVAEHPEVDIESNWKEIVRKSPLVKDANALINDGWGTPYEVTIDASGNIEVHSQKRSDYEASKLRS